MLILFYDILLAYLHVVLCKYNFRDLKKKMIHEEYILFFLMSN